MPEIKVGKWRTIIGDTAKVNERYIAPDRSGSWLGLILDKNIKWDFYGQCTTDVRDSLAKYISCLCDNTGELEGEPCPHCDAGKYLACALAKPTPESIKKMVSLGRKMTGMKPEVHNALIEEIMKPEQFEVKEAPPISPESNKLMDDYVEAKSLENIVPKIEVGQLWRRNFGNKGTFKVLAVDGVNELNIIVQDQGKGFIDSWDSKWILTNCDQCRTYTPEIRMPDESALPAWAVGYFAIHIMNRFIWAYSDCDGWRLSPDKWEKEYVTPDTIIPPEYAPQNVPDDFDWRESWVEVQR